LDSYSIAYLKHLKSALSCRRQPALPRVKGFVSFSSA
jgi:hypothetical protein